MKEDTETLAELMLHAEQFCSKVEDAIKTLLQTRTDRATPQDRAMQKSARVS